MHVDRSDTGSGRAVAAPSNELVDGGSFALGKGGDGAVGIVAREAGDTEPVGFILCGSAKVNALDPAADAQ